MSDQSKMSCPVTLEDSNVPIGSVELQDGITHLILPDMIDGIPLHGPAHVLVKVSARQAKEKGFLTSGTYGRHGSTSSSSADLGSFLVNKLKARLNTDGSILFKMTWKVLATPSGRLYSLLRASRRPISDHGYGSWPTPTSNNGTGAGAQGRQGGQNLQTAANMASWATPSARDYRSNEGSVEFHQKRAEQTRGKPLSEQVHQLSGMPATGFPASTENRGQLNPAFPRWLQGYPKEWCEAAILAHRSMQTPVRKDE